MAAGLQLISGSFAVLNLWMIPVYRSCCKVLIQVKRSVLLDFDLSCAGVTLLYMYEQPRRHVEQVMLCRKMCCSHFSLGSADTIVSNCAQDLVLLSFDSMSWLQCVNLGSAGPKLL